MSEVFVITLQLDHDSQTFFQTLRDRYFPSHRNLVPAHVTLFHAVPSSMLKLVQTNLEEITTTSTSFEIDVTGLRFMGSGVMYELLSTDLISIHASLQKSWWEQLTNQDRQRFKPHIVIQNKVAPAEARQTLDTLSREFKPFKTTANSILLWTYLGGPWRLEKSFPFLAS